MKFLVFDFVFKCVSPKYVNDIFLIIEDDKVNEHFVCPKCGAILQRQSWMSDIEWDEYIDNYVENHECNENGE